MLTKTTTTSHINKNKKIVATNALFAAKVTLSTPLRMNIERCKLKICSPQPTLVTPSSLSLTSCHAPCSIGDIVSIIRSVVRTKIAY